MKEKGQFKKKEKRRKKKQGEKYETNLAHGQNVIQHSCFHFQKESVLNPFLLKVGFAAQLDFTF